MFSKKYFEKPQYSYQANSGENRNKDNSQYHKARPDDPAEKMQFKIKANQKFQEHEQQYEYK